MAKRNQVTKTGRFFIARNIRPTSTAGTAPCRINLRDQKRRPGRQQVFKRRCDDNREIHHTAASRGGPENPRATRVKRFPTGNR